MGACLVEAQGNLHYESKHWVGSDSQFDILPSCTGAGEWGFQKVSLRH